MKTKLEELKAAYEAAEKANEEAMLDGIDEMPDEVYVFLDYAAEMMPTLLEAVELLETVSSARACQDHEFDVDAWFKQVRSLLGNLN